MKAFIPTVLCFLGVGLSGNAAAADAEGCADLKILPRVAGCVIQECSAKQHDSFETAGADIVPGTAGPLDANVNSLAYSCPASMDLPHIRQELEAAIHKAGFLNVAEDKSDPDNPVITARKGAHWIRWSANSEDGGVSYWVTAAANGTEKFKAEACAGTQVLTLQKSCEIVDCASKSEDTAGMRTGLKQQTTVTGTVQAVTLACPAIAPVQALATAEDEMKRSGFEILFSDRERPESGGLTGRAGKHWVELVSGSDGDSISYALTSIASGEVVATPSQEARVQQGSAVVVAAESAPVVAPASASETPVVEAIAPVPVPPETPAAPRPVSTENPVPAATPTPAVSATTAPTGLKPVFTPPKPLVKEPIQSTQDLLSSIVGAVVIHLLVDVREDGTVSSAKLTGKINKYVLRLESVAVAAAMRWQFEPARQDGRAVPAVQVPIEIHFMGRPWQY